MPVIKTIHDDDITIALWLISEKENELLDYVGLVDDLPLNKNRRLERLATMSLLKTLGFKQFYAYDCFGRPYFPASSVRISISHTNGIVALAFSESQEVGVDIEQTTRNYRKIAGKYLSTNEAIGFHNYSDFHYALIWSAKETIYKLPWGKSLVFNRDIEIDLKNFNSDRGWLKARVFNDGAWVNVKLFYTFIDNYCLTWTGMNRIL
ncbi:MAG: 4-phosphopantetheinyl transferase [Tenuifilum sp.]|uniref:4'-phosphopantetheinyl transferase family protein n=1 Tax=Tenuifilum sp. TaxID=2760880 RepID=UPI0024AB4DF6|nr:4'-phosphopantetheinyl transferase superfamily protein [Tenuifilum sp.]MDI3528057.1 4-phosphopantetheinyl transferase [Tenuifilum sp.]